MKTLHCYEIPHVFRDTLDRSVDADTGEMTEAGLNELRTLTLQASASSLNLACYIRELELEAEAVKAIATATAERASTLLKRATHLRFYLMEALDAMGQEKVSDSRISLAIRDNPPSVSVENADLIPPTYRRIKWEPEKTLIKDALKAGTDVPGCSLITTRRLAIK